MTEKLIKQGKALMDNMKQITKGIAKLETLIDNNNYQALTLNTNTGSIELSLEIKKSITEDTIKRLKTKLANKRNEFEEL